MGEIMANKHMLEPEFEEMLCLLAQGYGKDELITKHLNELARLAGDDWAVVALRAVGGAPSASLNIKIRDKIINITVNLAAILNITVLKKYEKNYKCRGGGQEEIGTSNTESKD
jgi:hypothetical protein